MIHLLDASRWYARHAGLLASGVTYGSTLIASASGNVKGAYSSLSTTPFRVSGLVVTLFGANTADFYLVDIGIGASNTQVLIPNLPVQPTNVNMNGISLFVPIQVAAGETLQARCQCATGSATILIALGLVAYGLAGLPMFGRAQMLGADTSDSTATSLDAGAVANTLSAWVQLGTLAFPAFWAVPIFGNQCNTAPTTGTFAVNFGLGAGGAEQPLNLGFPVAAFASLDSASPLVPGGGFPLTVKAGESLAARIKSTITTAGDRSLDCALLVLG